MSQAPKHGQNLLTIIFLAKKCIKIFLKKVNQLLEIAINKEIFGLADIIENWYMI